MKEITLVTLVKYGDFCLYMLNVRCMVNPYGSVSFTMILLMFYTGPPTLVSISDETVRVNVSEEVVLNCSVSSSPDSAYNWSIPKNCSFCPHSYNHTVLSFITDSTDSGESNFICTARNKHGSISIVFNVFVNGM